MATMNSASVLLSMEHDRDAVRMLGNVMLRRRDNVVELPVADAIYTCFRRGCWSMLPKSTACFPVSDIYSNLKRKPKVN